MTKYNETELRVIQLASEALDHAFSRDWDKITATLVEINETGEMGLAMMAWCDYFARHAAGEMPTAGVPTVLTMFNVQTGELQSLEDSPAPPEVKWAARTITARVRMDRRAWTACLSELPEDDGRTVGLYVTTLLETVARTCQGLPEGYAVFHETGRLA